MKTANEKSFGVFSDNEFGNSLAVLFDELQKLIEKTNLTDENFEQMDTFKTDVRNLIEANDTGGGSYLPL